MLHITIAVLTTLVSLIAWPILRSFYTFWRQRELLKAIPSPKSPSWFWGHARYFSTTDIPVHLANAVAECGSVFKLRFLNRWLIIVTDPALVRAVLQTSKTYIPKHRIIYSPIETASTPHLPTILTSSDGDYWKAVRAAWMKCFTSTSLKQYLPVVVNLCEKVVQQQLAAAAASDTGTAAVLINELTDRITLDVIGHVSYGRDYGAVDVQRTRYLHLVNSQLQLMHDNMKHPLSRIWHTLFPNKQQAALHAEWNAVNTRDVKAAMQHPPEPNTLIGQLLQVKDPATNKTLNLDQLKAEMVLATVAGFETTSMGLTWILGSLACHHEVMLELERELDDAGLLASEKNPDPRQFAWQQLGRLPYLQAVIREGLRLFSPAATGTWRLNLDKDTRLRDDVLVPKGVAVGIPFFAFGHDPNTYGADVEAFRPERWLPGRSNSSSSSSSSGGGLANNSSSSSSSSVIDSADDISPAAADTDDLDAVAAVDPAAAAAAARPTTTAAAAAAANTGSSSSSTTKLHDPWTFSIGPRDCAGQALARLELQVVIATLVGRFEISLAPEVGGWEGLLNKRMYHTTLQVRGGLPVLLKPRVVP